MIEAHSTSIICCRLSDWGSVHFHTFNYDVQFSRRLEHLFMLSITVVFTNKVAKDFLLVHQPSSYYLTDLLPYVQMFCFVVFCSTLLQCFYRDFGIKIPLTINTQSFSSLVSVFYCICFKNKVILFL